MIYLKYWIKTALEDFEDYRKKNPHHSAKEIIDDFERFASERKQLQKLFDKMSKGKEPTAVQSEVLTPKLNIAVVLVSGMILLWMVLGIFRT